MSKGGSGGTSEGVAAIIRGSIVTSLVVYVLPSRQQHPHLALDLPFPQIPAQGGIPTGSIPQAHPHLSTTETGSGGTCDPM